MADAVATLTGLLYSGEMEDGQGAHGYQVKGNFQQLLSKQTELINAYNAMIAEYLELINTNDAAAVLADTGMLARLDALEAEIAGTFAAGATIGNVRVGLEDGRIEAVTGGIDIVAATGEDTTINGLVIDADGKVGPQERITGDQHSLSGNEVTYVGGAKVYAGAIIDNVVEVSGSPGVYVPSTSIYGKKAFIVRNTNPSLYDFNIPPYTSVPIGTEWLIVNLSGHTFDVGSLSSLADGASVKILCTQVGWLIIQPATVVTTIS